MLYDLFIILCRVDADMQKIWTYWPWALNRMYLRTSILKLMSSPKISSRETVGVLKVTFSYAHKLSLDKRLLVNYKLTKA